MIIILHHKILTMLLYQSIIILHLLLYLNFANNSVHVSIRFAKYALKVHNSLYVSSHSLENHTTYMKCKLQFLLFTPIKFHFRRSSGSKEFAAKKQVRKIFPWPPSFYFRRCNNIAVRSFIFSPSLLIYDLSDPKSNCR